MIHITPQGRAIGLTPEMVARVIERHERQTCNVITLPDAEYRVLETITPPEVPARGVLS